MIELPDDSPEVVADWIELYLAVDGDAVSKAEMGSIIEAVLGQDVSEDLLSSIWFEFSPRFKWYFTSLSSPILSCKFIY